MQFDNTEVFNLYVGGFGQIKDKPVIIMRRKPVADVKDKIKDCQVTYNGNQVPVDTELKLYVEGVISMTILTV